MEKAEVMRICKKCWLSLKHYVYIDENKGEKIVVCSKCGMQTKEEN